MLWFSQNYRRETEDFFLKNLPSIQIQPFLMVWHCGENDGIVPDTQRYGRRTYETAMLLTLGDRKIVKPKGLSYSASREARTRVHRSQKPFSVLTHFMEMFVDNASSILDPTAGSGTSLLAARSLKAERILGIEKDEGIYKNAYNHINGKDEIGL
jgi:DNA modification methylase